MTALRILTEMFVNLAGLQRFRPWNAFAAASFVLFALKVDAAEPAPVSVLKVIEQPTGVNANKAPSKVTVNLDGPELKNSLTWSEALRAVLLTSIPDKYEDLSHWGKTTEIFGGIRVRQRGLNIKVSERKQTVNHGAWHRYKIEFIDPANTLKLVIDQIQPTGIGQFQFEIRLASKLRCRADFEHWLLGVKGLNLTVVSEAEVQIVANCQLSIRTAQNRKTLIPDLVIEPRVNRIRLSLNNLDVKRIGEIRGDIAEGIGDISRRDIENLLQAQESRAVKKANEAIEKKRNSLKFSVFSFQKQKPNSTPASLLKTEN